MEGTESGAQASETKAASSGFIEEELRPFADIKSKVEDIIDNVVQKNFTSKPYEAKSIQHLVNLASEEIIKQCQEEISTNYKFMSTLIALQKGEAGFHMGASCFWEAKCDGNFNKKYEFDEFYLVVNFFGITRN